MGPMLAPWTLLSGKLWCPASRPVACVSCGGGLVQCVNPGGWAAPWRCEPGPTSRGSTNHTTMATTHRVLAVLHRCASSRPTRFHARASHFSCVAITYRTTISYSWLGPPVTFNSFVKTGNWPLYPKSHVIRQTADIWNHQYNKRSSMHYADVSYSPVCDSVSRYVSHRWWAHLVDGLSHIKSSFSGIASQICIQSIVLFLRYAGNWYYVKS